MLEVDADRLPVMTGEPEVTKLASSTAADLMLSVSAAAPIGSERAVAPLDVGEPQADSLGVSFRSFLFSNNG